MQKTRLITALMAVIAVSAAHAAPQYTYQRAVPTLKPASTTTPQAPPAPVFTYVAEVSTAALTFTPIAAGQTAEQSVLLSNIGTGALSLEVPTVSGEDFSSATNCGASLEPATSCSVTVSYRPLAEKDSSGLLTFGSNATAGALTTTLSGSAFRTDPYYGAVAYHLSGQAAAGTALADSGPGHNSMTVSQGVMVPGFSPFGAKGRSFKTNGGYFAPSTSLALGANNFTYETWVYLDGPLTYKASGGPYIASILGSSQTTASSAEIFISGPGTTPNAIGMTAAASSAVTGVTSAYPFALNTWYHIAAVRNNGTLSLYINGNRIVSSAISGSYAATQPRLGAQSFSGWGGNFNGYLSDTRMTMGVARYTGTSLPVPTEPMPAR